MGLVKSKHQALVETNEAKYSRQIVVDKLNNKGQIYQSTKKHIYDRYYPNEPLTDWSNLIVKHHFNFEHKGCDSKTAFLIYLTIKFNKAILINHMTISNQITYGKLIVNLSTSDFIILNHDQEVIFMIINHKLHKICSQLMICPNLDQLTNYGFKSIIEESKLNFNKIGNVNHLSKIVSHYVCTNLVKYSKNNPICCINDKGQVTHSYLKKMYYREWLYEPWTDLFIETNKWKFKGSYDEDYKCLFLIYSKVKFNDLIMIHNRYSISNLPIYDKLVINTINNDFIILGKDHRSPIQFKVIILVINNHALSICSQLIRNPSAQQLESSGFTSIIDYLESRQIHSFYH